MLLQAKPAAVRLLLAIGRLQAPHVLYQKVALTVQLRRGPKHKLDKAAQRVQLVGDGLVGLGVLVVQPLSRVSPHGSDVGERPTTTADTNTEQAQTRGPSKAPYLGGFCQRAPVLRPKRR
jgi:hypothetical protein